ncbi:hypothetical protein SteCoe_22988 [Stentor coeruleus]|uniref:Tyrosine-protein kinase ephrin type A/B receptor-like domain-containing protein n=1 Tax=Stentor coeruleus TaxID=5963 RepID=A0A1R2BKW1_9CILI|nr:hypothetical protein SteCoe_22988 [Stentor coeruleus]
MRLLLVFYFLTFVESWNVYIPSTKTPPANRAAICISYIHSKDLIITFGGFSGKMYYSDTWAFYLSNNTWEDVILTSDINPCINYLASRIYYGGFTSVLNDKFYIFGGKTYTGLKNDFWEFDPNDFSWTNLITKNPPSMRQAYAFTSYLKDGNEYFAIFGGETQYGSKNDLHILNMTTLEWTEMENFGIKMNPYSYNCMEYFNGCFYATSGLTANHYNFRLYKYCLDDQMWVELTDPNETEDNRAFHQCIIYGDYFYVLSGGLTAWFEPIIKVNIAENNYLWAVDEKMPLFAVDSYGLALRDNILYFFGGFNYEYNSYTNEFYSIDLDTGNNIILSYSDLSPEKRSHASMTAINGELYLFGGKTLNTLYNNMWVFNIEKEKWRVQSMSGELPTPRHSHAVDSDGDALVLFGGEDISGFRNDLFIYNSLNSDWKKLIPNSGIIPRSIKGACLALKFPIIYIYGGITESGLSGELWQFDIGSLEYKKLSSSIPKSYSKCYILDNLFYCLEGSSINDSGMQGYSIYDIDTDTWEVIKYEYYPYANSIQILLNDTFVKVGGQQWLIELSGDATIFKPDGSMYWYPDTFAYVYFSAFTYYRDRIYSFGGGSCQGLLPIFIYGSYDFYYIDMKEICSTGECNPICSKGTYKSDQGCIECEPGSYSEIMGSEICKLCPIGTYNSIKGGSSYRQCLPCPEETFNSKPGSSLCFECPAGFNCPAGSKQPNKINISDDYSSVQPKMYSSDDNSINLIYILVVMTVFLFLIIIVLSISNFKNKLNLIDFYIDKHNYNLNEPMILTKNQTGGFFSLIFLIIAIIFVGSSIIEYKINNIQETKALVPLIILEENSKIFTADKLEIECTLIGYRGDCEENYVCNPKIFINITNLYGSFKHSCKASDNEECVIKLTCYNCELRGGASIFINSKEKLSYASKIYVNITSDSSIPNEISSIRNELYASKKYVFIGSEASKFYYTLTPSLFKSQSSMWKSELTGYHVSSEQFPLHGSQSLDIDLPISAELKVIIFLYKSGLGLFTDRIFKQSVLIFISGILGSVFGILGSLAGIMRFYEGKYNSLMQNFLNRKSFYDIKNKRRMIHHTNFGKDNEILEDHGSKGTLIVEEVKLNTLVR